MAAISLSSCSSAQYAFHGRTPAYLGAQRITSTVAPNPEEVPAAELTASATDDLAPVVAPARTPARHAAAALARRRVLLPAPRRAPATGVAPAAAEPTKTVVAVVTRQAVKQELKRQLATSQGSSAEGKSQLVAALLCFFLGGLGIHDFYLGYIGKGILQIFLSLIVIGFILVIIDFVRILTGSLKPKGGEYAKKL
ncbi:MAG: hypothetical protein NVS3B25_28970 [Hymenobacter sp.]